MSAGTTEAALARYAAGECSLVELARVLGITRREVRAALERAGISVRHPGRPSGSSRLAGILTEDYLRREVLEGCRAVAEVAADVGCTPKTVRRYLRTSGIVNRAAVANGGAASWDEEFSARPTQVPGPHPDGSRPDGSRPDGSRPDGSDGSDGFRPAGVAPGEKAAGTGLTREALWEAYIVRASSTTAIAAAAGCAPSTVGRDLRRHGIKLRRRGGAPPSAVRLGRRRAGIRRAVQAADS